mgnify:CR=1 FL=1
MKRIILILIAFISVNVYAQQKGISYQAVILNPKGASAPGVDVANSPLTNKNVCMLFEIVDGSTQVEYQETIQTITDQFGMVNLVIGTGTKTGGYAANFSRINWAGGNKKLVVKINTSGNCSSYTEISNQPLMYAPYALFAETSSVNDGAITDAKIASGISPSKVGLGNVNNTSDANKPVSIATQSALDTKENLSNKSTSTALGTSDVLYPTQNAVKSYVDSKVLTGAKGDKGDTGATGAAGVNGLDGAKGEKGDKGDAGEKGDKGDTGATGAAGVNGLDGAKGEKGDKGDTGATGADGAKGEKGDKGETGATGPQGIPGLDGASAGKGDKGDTGATGPQGIAGTNGIDGAKGDKGDTGEKGDKGETGATGATGPQGIAGTNGTNGLDGAKGDTGATGPQGLQGIAGATGAKGDKGDTGATGPQGPQGANGATGSQGVAGATGAKGDKGDTGATGPQGATGATGAQGIQGVAGAKGETGATGAAGSNASITVGAIGSTANANGASITSGVLNLSPANETNGGVITTGTQSISGAKTFTTSVTSPIYASTPNPLTPSGSTITWNPALGLNASVTLTGNSTLAFSSAPVSGTYGTLVVTQPAGGGATLTLPSGTHRVLGSASTTTVGLSTAGNAVDIVSFYYNGSTYYWNVGQGYGTAAPAAAATNLATGVTGTLAIANGGTSATTKAAAFDALNPMTTTGDIIIESSTGVASRLGIGSTGQVLTVASGLPAWAAPSGVSAMSAIGSTPNANGASISGSNLTLQPADGSNGGILTNGTQTIAGAKTFSGNVTARTYTITAPVVAAAP